MKIYLQIDIKSPADYPKKEDIYFCNRSGIMTVQKLLTNSSPEISYMREIRYYLQPIEIKNISLIKLKRIINLTNP